MNYASIDSRINRINNVQVPIGTVPFVNIKLKINNLPNCVTEAELRDLLEGYGKVLELDQNIEPKYKKQNIFYATMQTISHADFLIASLHKQFLFPNSIKTVSISYAKFEHERLGIKGENEAVANSCTKLYVGCLAFDCSVEEVKALFSRFGTVKDVVLMNNNSKNFTKKSAFVRFDMKEQAFYAIEQLNGSSFASRSNQPLKVCFAKSRDKSRNKRYCILEKNTVSKKYALKPLSFSQCVSNSRCPTSSLLANQNPRNIGEWLEFYTPEGRAYYYNCNRNTVSWDLPKKYNSFRSFKYTCTICLMNLPLHWTEQNLLKKVSTYGLVIFWQLKFDYNKVKPLKQAVVIFSSIKSSRLAVERLNGLVINNRAIKVFMVSDNTKISMHANNNELQNNAPKNGQLDQKELQQLYWTKSIKRVISI